jgi:hypothetical protein
MFVSRDCLKDWLLLHRAAALYSLVYDCFRWHFNQCPPSWTHQQFLTGGLPEMEETAKAILEYFEPLFAAPFAVTCTILQVASNRRTGFWRRRSPFNYCFSQDIYLNLRGYSNGLLRRQLPSPVYSQVARKRGAGFLSARVASRTMIRSCYNVNIGVK